MMLMISFIYANMVIVIILKREISNIFNKHLKNIKNLYN